MDFDCLVVGSGFSGLVLAERFANQARRNVLVIERRSHVGGNCHDTYNSDGVLFHQYGPHIFHTQDERVWTYLSDFTEWRPYQHKVRAFIDGQTIPLPFNLNSIHQSFPAARAEQLEQALVARFGFDQQIPILSLRQDPDFGQLAEYVYQKVFATYSKKQWGTSFEKLDEEVTNRVPVRISRDDRYFLDRYQGMPREGYHKLFHRMLEGGRIRVLLNTEAREVIRIDESSGRIYFMNNEFSGKVFYTGPLDELFGYRFGQLPYRSLDFLFETLDREVVQEVAVVNYPNDHDYTRITEYKLLTGQVTPKTTLSKEFPCDYVPDKNIPYYAVLNRQNRELYQKYRDLADRVPNLVPLGRLAEYKYYNMDAAVGRALEVFDCFS